MNLNTIVEVKRPASADEITVWRDGYAWLGGCPARWSRSRRRPSCGRACARGQDRAPSRRSGARSGNRPR